MVDCLIIRRNRTMKRFNVSDKKDEFDFEGGRYYVLPDNVMHRKYILWFTRPFLLYFEGVPIPIGCDDIRTSRPILDDKDKANAKLLKTHILINSKSIHDIVSTDVLSVLTRHNLSKFEWILLGLVILTLLISIGGVNV